MGKNQKLPKRHFKNGRISRPSPAIFVTKLKRSLRSSKRTTNTTVITLMLSMTLNHGLLKQRLIARTHSPNHRTLMRHNLFLMDARTSLHCVKPRRNTWITLPKPVADMEKVTTAENKVDHLNERWEAVKKISEDRVKTMTNVEQTWNDLQKTTLDLAQKMGEVPKQAKPDLEEIDKVFTAMKWLNDHKKELLAAI